MYKRDGSDVKSECYIDDAAVRCECEVRVTESSAVKERARESVGNGMQCSVDDSQLAYMAVRRLAAAAANTA